MFEPYTHVHTRQFSVSKLSSMRQKALNSEGKVIVYVPRWSKAQMTWFIDRNEASNGFPRLSEDYKISSMRGNPRTGYSTRIQRNDRDSARIRRSASQKGAKGNDRSWQF